MAPTNVHHGRMESRIDNGWCARLGACVVLVVASAFAGCDDDGDDRSNPSGVGNRCASDEDCETGTCFIRGDFGYCTKPCTVEGDTSECPPDSICKPIQGGERRCLLICGSETACGPLERCDRDYCPEGSSCGSVASTSLLACEPTPE